MARPATGSAMGRHTAAATMLPQKAPAGPHELPSPASRPRCRRPISVSAKVIPEIRESTLPSSGLGAVAETGSTPTKKRPSPRPRTAM